MKFPDLSQMGHHYQAEEGTEGVRRGVLDGYAAQLRMFQMNLAQARAEAAPPVQGGSIKDRIAFFNSDLTKRREDAERRVREIQKNIDSLQVKLARQGGVLLPDGNINWLQTSRQVVYDHTAAARGLTQLRYRNGLLYADAACTTKFDTTAMVTAFGGRGWCIYVMSSTGTIHVSSHAVGNRHHSSLLAGGDTSGAGELRVLQGKLVHISNKSGHYVPAAAHFVQVLYMLRKRGVSLFNTKISFLAATGHQEFPTVQAFEAHLVTTGVDTDFEFVKMMAYINHLPYPVFASLAAANGWRWGNAADFIPGAPAAGGRGMVRIADGTQVSPRDVRKWLKTQGKTFGPNVQSGYDR